MESPSLTWLIIGVAASLLLSGCMSDLGGLGDPAPGGPYTPHDGLPDRLSTEPPEADNDPETVTFTLALAVEDDSDLPVNVLDVQVQRLPEGSAGLVAEPGLIRPGEHRPVAFLVLNRGVQVPSSTVDIELHDGVGRAVATVNLAGWTAEDDTTDLVRISTTSDHKILVQGVYGPVDGTPARSEASPEYGYLAWPDGTREPLLDFDHVIEVPQGYPEELEKGDRVRFRIPTAYTSVTWYMDGEEYHTGATLPLDIGAGPHTLSVQVGDQGAEAELRYVTDDHIAFHGHILAGTPAVEEHVSGVNGNLLFFPIFEEARDLRVSAHPTASTGPTDIDLYLYNPSGDLVAKAEGPRPFEDLRYAGPFVEGDHQLEIHGAKGVDVRFNATIMVDYTP